MRVEFRGQEHEFPDGITEDQIRAALQSTVDAEKDSFNNSPETQQATQLGVDFEFIRSQEGGAATAGYVPEDAPSGVQSGVTIATGLDLGQHDVAGLRSAGIPDVIIEKLRPYIGLRGTEATAALEEASLGLSDDEVSTIDGAISGSVTADLARRFNKDSTVSFNSLPKEWQTAIASVAFQYGTDLKTRTPEFWEQITTGDFESAIGNLRNFGDAYDTRRNKEADLVQNLKS